MKKSMLVLFFAIIFSGCAPIETPKELAPENLSYNFKFTPPGPIVKKLILP